MTFTSKMSVFHNTGRVMTIYKFMNYNEYSRTKVHIMECNTLYCMSKKSLLIKYSMTLHVQEVLTILYCLQEYILSVQEV